ncbi:YjzC family protein [Bacillus sp. FJAT-44742]|uniref:YjzC family protein n=1 Tax=Bacillus sp. FJAT-44742 TaxID=2014005 RepID=UPI000C244846|nr:YjzC family protein [Bacillus sp. FJAT-44742]
MTKKNKPGKETRKTGTHEQIGPRGGKTNITADLKKGQPYPPTSKPNSTWRKKS